MHYYLGQRPSSGNYVNGLKKKQILTTFERFLFAGVKDTPVSQSP